MTEVHDGRRAIELQGFSYLPQFISKDEAAQLISYFGQVHPLWERRHHGRNFARDVEHPRRLTRPVYWLGAWQFACLGYYSEPKHREERCVRAEPLPPLMQDILARLGQVLCRDHSTPESLEEIRPLNEHSGLPNTCLINYYGRQVGDSVPVDFARLRMHRDGEIGPVIMLSIGQPGLLEFIDPDQSDTPELSIWTRHRSICILSGPEFKERLYHRVSKVRTGAIPAISSSLKNFEVRRVSVSFRHVPEELIDEYSELPLEKRGMIRDYLAELSESSEHFRAALAKESES